VAAAAPPQFYGIDANPSNPRTGAEVSIIAFGHDPENKSLQSAWDFAGGTAFGALAAGPAKHTFTTDGIHWISNRLQDADGEKTDTRLLIATHPDNWAPIGTFDSTGRAFNELTQDEDYSSGQYLSFHDAFDPDGPSVGGGGNGLTYAWDLDNDGDFNDTTGDGEPLVVEGETIVYQRIAHFTSDGTHPIKVKLTDAQGAETIVSGSVRTHTANEAPYYFATSMKREFDPETVAAGEAKIFTNWDDDYSYGAISYVWRIGDTVQAGATADDFTLPSNLGPGTYQVSVTATDDGRHRGEGPSDPTGPALHKTLTIPVTVGGSYPATLYAHGLSDSDNPKFRTLENVYLSASPAHPGPHATGYAWDLDNDGAFDDATGYSTYFASPKKGTFKVSVRMTMASGDPVVLSRDLVVDSGQDYAVPGIGGGGNTNTGGGNTGGGNTGGGNTGGGNTTTPVVTPEQAKAAMATFLNKALVTFLTELEGLFKALDQQNPSVTIGTLDATELPNGGKGKFTAHDKPASGGKVVARAAAAKRKLLGSTTVTIAKGESKKVKLKLNKKGKALLKKKGKVKLTIDATLTDALTGAQVTQSKTYTFKVKKAKKKKK
jgi:hypothetical protein